MRKPKAYYYTVAVRHITKSGNTRWVQTETTAMNIEELAAALDVSLDDVIYRNKRCAGYHKSSMAKYWENLPVKQMSEETKEYLRNLTAERKALRNKEGERVYDNGNGSKRDYPMVENLREQRDGSD